MDQRPCLEHQVPPSAISSDTGDPGTPTATPTRVGRRGFLRFASGTAAALAASLVAPCAGGGLGLPEARAEAIGPLGPLARSEKAFSIRVAAATFQASIPPQPHPDNNDEERYPTRFASYSKALPHDRNGDVHPAAYNALLAALRSGRPADFEQIPLGSPPSAGARLTDPQAAYAFVLEGADPHALAIRPAPTFVSDEEQAEAAELYWQSLLRDVSFHDYDTNPLALAAAADLSKLPGFRGPRLSGRVTPQTLFRIDFPGVLTGPYVSQFLLLDVPYGVQSFAQRNLTRVPGDDQMDTYDDWLAVQNGRLDIGGATYDPVRRYLRNGRDLAEFVHLDFSYQAALNAALVLFGFVPAEFGVVQPTYDLGNPYLTSRTQAGFATFGRPDVLDRLARVAVPALKAAWFQKWLVHRRLRPEEYGGRVQNTLARGVPYPIGKVILHQSSVLKHVYDRQGTYLLSQAYPEGSPTHPAYPSGHAVFVGAEVTMVKAFFRESYVLSNPVVPSADGLRLLPYRGADLTLGGELNKLAMNVAIGRDFAGVHWRSDAEEGLRLGEAVAVRIMKDLRRLYNADFEGFSLTLFDGRTITI